MSLVDIVVICLQVTLDASAVGDGDMSPGDIAC